MSTITPSQAAVPLAARQPRSLRLFTGGALALLVWGTAAAQAVPLSFTGNSSPPPASAGGGPRRPGPIVAPSSSAIPPAQPAAAGGPRRPGPMPAAPENPENRMAMP